MAYRAQCIRASRFAHLDEMQVKAYRSPRDDEAACRRPQPPEEKQDAASAFYSTKVKAYNLRSKTVSSAGIALSVGISLWVQTTSTEVFCAY